MTKILYIPNGEYLKFFNFGSPEMFYINMEDINETELIDMVKRLNTSEMYSYWKEVNNLKTDVFFLSEFELIYD